MTTFEYNLIALLALITPAIFVLTRSKEKRSLLGFLILYGISFLITLFIFWFVKTLTL